MIFQNNYIDEVFNPSELKKNLIYSSLFVAYFENLKNTMIEKVKFLFNATDFNGNTNLNSTYYIDILKRNKNEFKSILIWLKEMNCIDDFELKQIDDFRNFRNQISHHLFEEIIKLQNAIITNKLIDLLKLIIKIDKWWIINIDNTIMDDNSERTDLKEDEIITSTQIITNIIFDILNDKLINE